MSDVPIIIRLPETLLKRAVAVGLQIEDHTAPIIAVIEQQIRRAEAAAALRDFMDKVDALPDDVKLSLEEIEAELRAAKAERIARSEQNENDQRTVVDTMGAMPCEE